MTREQAINYLISSGFTHEQVGDVVRALTYEPTTKNDLGVDCINRDSAIKALDYDIKCFEFKQGVSRHMDDIAKLLNTIYETQVNNIKALPSATPQEPVIRDNGVKDELEPTTKNGISHRTIIYTASDCISRQAVIDMTGLSEWFDSSDSYNEFVIALSKLPSVTPQLSVPEATALAEWTEKLTKASEDAYKKGYEDGVKSVNICPHCGEYIGEEE